jgi:hypothetical protein
MVSATRLRAFLAQPLLRRRPARLVSQLYPQAGVRLAQIGEPAQRAVLVNGARLDLEPGAGQRVDVVGEPATPVAQVVESVVLAPPDGSGLLRDQLKVGGPCTEYVRLTSVDMSPAGVRSVTGSVRAAAQRRPALAVNRRIAAPRSGTTYPTWK